MARVGARRVGPSLGGRIVRQMEAVVAVDLMEAYVPAVGLFKALAFPSPSLSFINVVEPVLPDSSFPELSAAQPLTQIIDDLQAAGQEALERAVLDWPGATRHVVLGHAASSIIEHADKQHAEVVVIGSQRKSLLESLFSGSVAQGLTSHCPKSVLIGKVPVKADAGLTVVVTHDLSDYSTRAIEKFINMNPQGIARIVLLTADTTDPSIVAVVERIDPAMAGETHDVIKASIDQGLVDMASKLSRICPQVETVVSEGDVNKVIDETMKDVSADLLVLGAHGHGIVERLMVGSVAFHQVVRTTHNVFLVRA